MSNQITKTYRVYGAEGHRQRVSFQPSSSFDTWRGIHVDVLNSDVTGTNEYTAVKITADSEDTCLRELAAQIEDGIFENSRTGATIDADTGKRVWPFELLYGDPAKVYD